MNVKLNIEGREPFYITSDENQFIVHRGYVERINNDGKVSKSMKNKRHASSIDNVAWIIFNVATRETADDVNDMKGLMREINMIKRNIYDAFNITIEGEI